MAVLRADIGARYAPASANRMIATVRAIMQVCVRRGTMTRDAYERAVDIRPIRGSRVTRGRHMEGSELATAFRSVEAAAEAGSIHARRNLATLGLCYGAGLRRAEAVGIELRDLEHAPGAVLVRGKNDKERLVPLPEGTLDAIRRWLELRGGEPGWLLCVVSRDGRPLPKRGLHPTYVYHVTQTIAHAAGLRRFAPHDLRRTYAGDLLDAGADLSVVQSMMGHASPATTSRYDRRGLRAAAAAARLIRVPVARA